MSDAMTPEQRAARLAARRENARQRPMAELRDALTTLGVRIRHQGRNDMWDVGKLLDAINWGCTPRDPLDPMQRAVVKSLYTLLLHVREVPSPTEHDQHRVRQAIEQISHAFKLLKRPTEPQIEPAPEPAPLPENVVDLFQWLKARAAERAEAE